MPRLAQHSSPEGMEDDGEDEVKNRSPLRSSSAALTEAPSTSARMEDEGEEDDEGEEEAKAVDDGERSDDEDWEEQAEGGPEDEDDGDDDDGANEEEEAEEGAAAAVRAAKVATPTRRPQRWRRRKVKMEEEKSKSEEDGEGGEVEGDGGEEAVAAQEEEGEGEEEERPPITDGREVVVTLRSLNSHLACSLCKGYYREATAIIECAHTFCKVCLSNYIDQVNEHDEPECPKRGCTVKLRSADPLRNETKFDRALQNLVDKLLPQFQQRDDVSQALKRELQESAGLRRSISDVPGRRKRIEAPGAAMLFELAPHSSSSLPPLPKPVIRANAKATVKHLRKLIAQHLTPLTRLEDTDLLVLCCDELLGPDHSLEFVWRTRWHEQERHMTLTYKLLQ